MTKTTPGVAPQAYAPHQREDVWPPPSDLTGRRSQWAKIAQYTTDLQWNRVSNLQPSGPEVKTLPLGHSGLIHIM
ncbi:hypothetical protein AVEN_31800-1 [Araneus ventricosus]|uniref:Uncharacterized protein n=1 Tax=Araneus ventricosus TaxID=182803 RepID=A0A4Y2RVB8_ARAVE|nr:hypothetical protein AVEN_31800-1 [Araneus ventricosus]